MTAMTAASPNTEGLAPLLREVIDHGPEAGPVARLLGETPLRVAVTRTLFSARRPVQVVLEAWLPGGRTATILAELVPGMAEAHAADLVRRLSKSRYGQAAGAPGTGIVADTARGLVLRRPGLDERLPGLRLLHDPTATDGGPRDVLPGVPEGGVVTLVAHRLGKRAVLRIGGASGGVVYVRLRATKSDEGSARFALHRGLFEHLSDRGALRLPVPLGEAPALGASVFGALGGRPMALAGAEGAADCTVVGRAIAALQAAVIPDLPVHRAADELAILQAWLGHVQSVFPGDAARAGELLGGVAADLDALPTSALRPCHRDLHEGQILVQEGVAGILDFDTLCLSDPALDAGNLAAHLVLDRLRSGRDTRAAETALSAGPDPRRVAAWRRAALLRLWMIHRFTTADAALLDRLAEEAGHADRP